MHRHFRKDDGSDAAQTDRCCRIEDLGKMPKGSEAALVSHSAPGCPTAGCGNHAEGHRAVLPACSTQPLPESTNPPQVALRKLENTIPWQNSGSWKILPLAAAGNERHECANTRFYLTVHFSFFLSWLHDFPSLFLPLNPTS